MALAVALTLASVALVAVAQVLFKLAAQQVKFGGIDVQALAGWASAPMGAALVVSVAGTVLWVAALRSARLSVVYPLYALTFVAVPLLDRVVFATPLAPRYWIGAAAIVGGVWLMSGHGA